MKTTFLIIAVLVSALPSTVSHAQQTTSRPTLTLEAARQVIAVALDEATRHEAPGAAIAVVDDGGNVMALERLDGTFPAAGRISIGKARTAALFRRPTATFETIIKEGRTPMIALEDFTPLQGGIPIIVDGEVVGAVGVSGAASADQDEQIARVAATALGPEASLASARAPEPITYFDHATVAEAFSRGAVLFDGQGRNYMIHASRRDKAGQAEVHDDETDIIYVMSGTATFVTGGAVIDPEQSAPREVRGRAIDGGETRELRPGDVVIVPKGTPHWFREVPEALTYYVVKVK